MTEPAGISFGEPDDDARCPCFEPVESFIGRVGTGEHGAHGAHGAHGEQTESGHHCPTLTSLVHLDDALRLPDLRRADARGGRRIYFQHGSITWSATTKETLVVETPASP